MIVALTVGRRLYAAHVRFLRQAADRLEFLGVPDEVVARTVFAGRNALKLYHRRSTAPDQVKNMEERNVKLYGDPISLTIDEMFARYASWRAVTAAACRPGGRDMTF